MLKHNIVAVIRRMKKKFETSNDEYKIERIKGQFPTSQELFQLSKERQDFWLKCLLSTSYAVDDAWKLKQRMDLSPTAIERFVNWGKKDYI
jgi:hypothetical protein